MRTLSEAELVLQADGSIYHLGLHPGDIAPTVLTVGDPGRVARISRHFDTLDIRKQKREFLTHTGTLAGRPLSVVSTGIGPDNIDIVLNELDALVNIDLATRRVKDEHTVLNIIRVGTSGGLQADVPVESLVCARFGLGFDNLFRFYDHQPIAEEVDLARALHQQLDGRAQLPIEPAVFAGSDTLLDALGGHMESGITITAPGFYGPQGRHLRLAPRLQARHMEALEAFRFGKLRILNLEMETSAIYGLARLLGHRALACNTILANRPRATFTRDTQRAVDGLIEEVLTRISAHDLFLAP